MADLFHYFSGDLQFASNGDLQVVQSVQESQQRILRRLLTNQLDYWWHGEYGAGLPSYVGKPVNKSAMETLIKTQMYLEQSVVQSPQPQVTYNDFFAGLSALIQYVETDTQQQQTLSFSAKI